MVAVGGWRHVRSVLLIALMMPLAGCLGGNDTQSEVSPIDLPQPQFEAVQSEIWIAMSDGERLHGSLYLPDTNQTVGTFVNFSPYWGDSAETGGDAFGSYLIDEYVPRGFAVLLASIRGTGHSEGCFQIAGDRESLDLKETADWIATQEWSNGRVVMGGKSYDSTSQNGMISKFPSEHVTGLFHVSGITDMYRYNYVGGVPYGHGPSFNTYYYAQSWHEYGLPLPIVGGGPGSASEMDEDAESLARLIDDVACSELPLIQANGVGSAVTGLKTDYWIERDWNRYIGDSSWNGSIFFVHGLQDWNVNPDHILPWLTELPDEVHVMGYLHQWQQGGTGHVYPMRADWNHTMLQWLDWTLNGVDHGLGSYGVDSQSTNDQWYNSESWPPEGVREVYNVPRFQNESRIVGAPQFKIVASVEDPEAVLTATLRLNGTWVTEAVLKAMYKDGLEQPIAIQPGSVHTFVFDGFPVDQYIPLGGELTLHTQQAPRFGMVQDVQLEGITIVSAEVTFNRLGVPSEPQPVAIECFAC